METKIAKRTALIIALVILGIVFFTYIISFLIRGYRPNLKQQHLGLLPTGLLVASSEPKGASVYIDGKLATATNDTLSLSPGKYQIKIEKDGFLNWEKKLTIKKEIVTQTDAILFRNTPDLKPLTNTGALNPTFSPSKTKIVYGVVSASVNKKNGVWLLDLASNFPLSRASTKQLTGPIADLDWSKVKFIWDPDSKSVLLLEQKEERTTAAYLINADRFTAFEQLTDVSFRLSLILQEWEKEIEANLEAELIELPKAIIPIASEAAKLVTFSPDNEKFFYLATDTVEIPQNIIPHPPARSTQPETRKIEANNIYVYNLKEDTNFFINSAENLGINPEDSLNHGPAENLPLHWITSGHLVYLDQEKNEVRVIEIDAGNDQAVYAGPFDNGFVFPSSSGRSLVLLISLRPDSPGNLYEMKIR